MHTLFLITLQLIRELHLSTASEGEDQAQKGTQLLEIYALEIQMYNETKNFKKLKVRSCTAQHYEFDLTTYAGNLQCIQRDPVCYSTSANHGCY